MANAITDSTDWDLDDGSYKIVGEVQLKKYGQFLEKYALDLKRIQEEPNELMWDIQFDPISLKYVPEEMVSLNQLLKTDNMVLNKIVLVLLSLCQEMNQLIEEAQTKFYPALLYFGETNDPSSNSSETGSHEQIAKMLPILQQISCYLLRVQKVIKNVVQQLSALHSNSKDTPKIMDLTDVHFQVVYEHVGELLATLVTFDHIINNQSYITDQWTLYKRMIKAIRHNCSKFNISPDRLKLFENVLAKLESEILQAKMFQNCVKIFFDSSNMEFSKNSALADEFVTNISNYLAQVEFKIGEPSEMNHRSKLVSICCLLVLNFYIFRSNDKNEIKLFKQIWETHKKVPAITLTGNVLFFVDKFLLEQLPQMAKSVDKKMINQVSTQQINFLQSKSQSLPKDAQTYYMQVTLWLIKMESAFSQQGNLMDYLSKRCSLLINGLMLAYSMSHHIKTVMNLQLALNKPMTKTSVHALCKIIEGIKVIQLTFYRYSMKISDSINHLIQHLNFVAISSISTAKKRLLSDKKYNERHLDVASALILVEQAVNGPGTKDRRLLSHLAMAIGSQMQSFQEGDLHNFYVIQRKLDHVCNMWEKLNQACDCSFLFWHRVILPVYFDDISSSGTDCHRLQYMFLAIADCVKDLNRSGSSTSYFAKEINEYVKQHLLQPVCQSVETDLRLQIHSHLQLDSRNPFQVALKDFSPLLSVRPIRFDDSFVNVKGFVENYLDQTFYNLTTVALHDWKTYAEMRNLADHKFNLTTIDAHLPSQTLEQGLDVLEIMRNIHLFVSKYVYNLNNQIFVETTSNNKYLNTINIRHIANSIRTHGIGIMNTTVNFTYQFLRKKFFVFSQFMYDEHIKSRLIKDIRYFKEIKSNGENQKYPFERAEKFNRGIRRLGLTDAGLSYLDQFRQLVTHIGNAMGYVRMIRSGGLHCCSNAIRFVPDLDDIVSFEDLTRQENLSEEQQSAARKLDQVIQNLTKNFTEGTEYFKLLVDVFSPVFRGSQNQHLRNFYVIVPALTVNFVEHSITCKENMSKKNKKGAAFTDDGLAMGVAYILALLKQDQEFDSLQWFSSVSEKYRKEKEEVNKSSSTGKSEDEKLQQTLSLTLKRLDMYQREFDLLYYSLSSARIFFRTDRVASTDQPPVIPAAVESSKPDTSGPNNGDSNLPAI